MGKVLLVLSSDNKLTVNYQISESEATNLCLETWSILLNKRNPKRVLELTFKEFENFLRDENGLPAFDSDTQIRIEASFIFTKQLLFESWPWRDWELKNLNNSKSYIDNLRFIKGLFQQVNTVFELNNDLKLVHFEYEYVYFSNKSDLSLEILILSLQNFLTDKLQTPIKLVAVRT